MMNMLPTFQIPSKFNLHNMPMFSDVFSINFYGSVFMREFFTSFKRNSLWNKEVFGQTRTRTVCCLSTFNSIFLHIKLLITNFTVQKRPVSWFFAGNPSFSQVRRLTSAITINLYRFGSYVRCVTIRASFSSIDLFKTGGVASTTFYGTKFARSVASVETGKGFLTKFAFFHSGIVTKFRNKVNGISEAKKKGLKSGEVWKKSKRKTSKKK